MNLTQTCIHDHELIAAIARRAAEMAKRAGGKWNTIDAVMDIEACHRVIPLKLAELFSADDFNFAHDVFGINHNLNRDTGEIENYFLPRFSK